MNTYIVLDLLKLRAVRKRAGYSQESAAKLCNMTRQQLNHIETGFTRASADTLLTFCYIYNITDIKEIMSITDNPRQFRLRDKTGRVNRNEKNLTA